MDRKKKFLLLQVNDALFPIGGYSHSYGLETYIQKELVTNEEQAEEYVKRKLQNLLYNELFYCRLAWEAADVCDLERIEELEELFEAGRVPREIREASRKLGSRFVKTLQIPGVDYEKPIFKAYAQKRKGKGMNHVIAYGVFCGAIGVEREECLEHFLYAQTSAMVVNCVKTIPLSQTGGQRILVACYEQMGELLERVTQLPKELLGADAPGFDIRCMQHEALYSRIYMS